MDCQKKCKCKLLPCVPGIAAGILFAAVAGVLYGLGFPLLTAAAALSFSLSKAGVASILFIVGIAFFFVFMIVSFIRYLKCLAG